MGKWLNKTQYTHIVKYSSAAKRDELLTHTTTRVNLQRRFRPVTKRQSQRLHGLIPFTHNILKMGNTLAVSRGKDRWGAAREEIGLVYKTASSTWAPVVSCSVP